VLAVMDFFSTGSGPITWGVVGIGTLTYWYWLTRLLTWANDGDTTVETELWP
jgi:hypothetical protein